MGGKHSKSTAGGDQSTPSAAHEQSHAKYAEPAKTAEVAQQAAEQPCAYHVNVLGVTDADLPKLILAADHGAAIARALGPEYTTPSGSAEWVLLFNSNCHGKSFVRLVQHVCDRGPVVLVIRDLETQRVFGGFNESAWKYVATREREAKSAAAAVARAAREGNAVDASRPANQSRLFFGSAKSFLFTDTLPNGTKATSAESYPIYRSRGSSSSAGNSNFMYLFDVHPDEEKMGIGMGGEPGKFGWFLDHYLEKGTCAGPRCATYGNPLLVPLEEWNVDAVEAYAVHPREVDDLKAIMARAPVKAGRTVVEGHSKDKKRSVMNRGAETNCDKMLLELDMQHQFRDEEAQGGADDSNPSSDDDGEKAAKARHGACPPMYD